jgi:hypothetical protein
MPRTRGALNHLTREAAEMARGIITSPEYLAALRQRAIAGTLGSMEPVLWYFGFGKPKERVELYASLQVSELASLSYEELAERARVLVDVCHIAAEREDIIVRSTAIENSNEFNDLEPMANKEPLQLQPSNPDAVEAEAREALVQMLAHASSEGDV